MNLDISRGYRMRYRDCFYNNTISWHNPTTPNPADSHPRLVFERLSATAAAHRSGWLAPKETAVFSIP